MLLSSLCALKLQLLTSRTRDHDELAVAHTSTKITFICHGTNAIATATTIADRNLVPCFGVVTLASGTVDAEIAVWSMRPPL